MQFQGFDWLSGNHTEPPYHARERATIFKKVLDLLQSENSKIQQYFLIVFNKTIIPLALVGYEVIIVNSARYLSQYHIQRVLVE